MPVRSSSSSISAPPDAAGQGVREPAAHAVGDARAQQQLAHGRRQAGEHLAGQVVGHRAVVARELGDERVGVGLGEQREARQAQARRPALGPLDAGART